MSLVVIWGFDVPLFVRLFMAFQVARESFLRRLNLEHFFFQRERENEWREGEREKERNKSMHILYFVMFCFTMMSDLYVYKSKYCIFCLVRHFSKV